MLVGVAILAVSAAPVRTHGSRMDGSRAARDHDQVLQYWRCLLHQYRYARTALARTAVVLPTITTASGHARRGARHRSRRVPASAVYQRARPGTRTAWAKFIIYITFFARIIKTKSRSRDGTATNPTQTDSTAASRKGQPETQPNNPALPYILKST